MLELGSGDVPFVLILVFFSVPALFGGIRMKSMEIDELENGLEARAVN